MRRAPILAIAASFLLTMACAAAPDDGSEPRLPVAALDADAYAAMVQPVLEKRCGSLDCHGQLPRGLRVYGMNGLRLPNDAGNFPGVGATTAAEARATYVSVVGLEPEKLDALVGVQPRSRDDAYRLLVLAKPLAVERHRGGISLRRGEPAEQCLLTWVLGSRMGWRARRRAERRTPRSSSTLSKEPRCPDRGGPRRAKRARAGCRSSTACGRQELAPKNDERPR